MEQAGKSLWTALRRVARPEKPLDLLIAVWPLMVGHRLAGHTRPACWRGGEVEVAVRGDDWLEQLKGMGSDLRGQINRWWGSNLVRTVKIILDRAPASPARRPAPSHGRTAKPLASLAENKLEAALKELEGPLAGIADQELRELIERVAVKYLEKQGRK